MTAACPNCRGAMERIGLQSVSQSFDIDACFPCHLFWFDHMESPSLSEASILQLFKVIHGHRDAQRQTLGAKLACPRCKLALVRTQDLQRTNRIEYHRCTAGCGRVTTFFQFLREKNFIRSLSKAEMDQLRVQVSQVRCSSCGAMVAVEKDAACRHCGAAVSILDADAVEKRLTELNTRINRRPAPADYVPVRPASAKPARKPFDWEPRHGGWAAGVGGETVYDLVDDAIGSFANWFND